MNGLSCKMFVLGDAVLQATGRCLPPLDALWCSAYPAQLIFPRPVSGRPHPALTAVQQRKE